MQDGQVLAMSGRGADNHVADYEIVRKMRASNLVLGPLLARCGRVEVSLPGGCVFGVRPIDLHLKGMAALGAEVRIERGFIIAEAPPGGLVGASMYLGSAQGSSVTGTTNPEGTAGSTHDNFQPTMTLMKCIRYAP